MELAHDAGVPCPFNLCLVLFLFDNLENLGRQKVCKAKLLEGSCKFVNVHDGGGRRGGGGESCRVTSRMPSRRDAFLICQIRLRIAHLPPWAQASRSILIHESSRDSSWKVITVTNFGQRLRECSLVWRHRPNEHTSANKQKWQSAFSLVVMASMKVMVYR